jgi:ATP/maltotriose-dependent transcriptional regulator MalT
MKDEALMIARTSGDDTTIMRVLNNVFIPLMVPPLLEDTLARTADAMKRIDTVGDPVLRFFAFSWRAEAVGRAGHIDEMDRCREAAGSLARQLDQPGLLFIHALQRGLRAQIAGDTDRAEELALEALQVGTDGGQPDAALYFGAQLLVVQSQRGTMGEMIPQIEQIGATTPDLGASALNGVLARAHAEVGRLDDVRHLLEEFATDNFDLHLDSIWFAVMAGWAEAAIDYGDPLFAGPIFDRLAPWAEQLATGNGVTADCPVSHFLGGLATVLGRYDEAESYLAHATSFNERAGAKFFAARTDVLKAKMLAQRGAPGDAETARTFLTTALAAAVANGYAHVERRAAEALQMLNR